MGQIGCPSSSVDYNQSTLRNVTDQSRSDPWSQLLSAWFQLFGFVELLLNRSFKRINSVHIAAVYEDAGRHVLTVAHRQF